MFSGNRNLISENLSKEYLWSFFRVVRATELVIAALLLVLFVGVQVRTISRYSIAQLNQVSTQLDLLYDTLESVSHQILADHDTFTVLMSTDVDRLREAGAARRLRSIASGYPHIRFVGFYNSMTGRYIGSACVADHTAFGPEFFYDLLDGRSFVGIRRPVGVNFATQTASQTTAYTFTFAVQLWPGYMPSLIIVDIDTDYIDGILSHIRIDGRPQWVYLREEEGPVITVRTTETSQPPLPEISKNPQGQQLFRRWLVTYVQAPRMQWQLVNMVPFTYVFEGVVPVIFVSLLLLAVSLKFGYILSKRASNALVINAYNLSKHQYLGYLFEGEAGRVATAVYERLNIQLDSPYYAVVVIECTPKEEILISHYELEQVTREAVDGIYSIEFSRLRENIFAVLVYLEESVLKAELEHGLLNVVNEMEKNFDISICIGSVCDDWVSINLSYEQARVALKARPLHKAVFYHSEVSDPIQTDQYFSELKFTDYIHDGNIDACGEEFDRALGSLGNVSFEMARTYFQHTALSVLDDFAMYFGNDNESTRVLLTMVEKSNDVKNIRALRQAMMRFYGALAHRYDTLRQQGKGKGAITQVKDFIDLNYSDPNLSIGALAEQVGLTSAYLGKRFAVHTGMTFNDYLARLRMWKAAELLVSTDNTVKEVSEGVGILNTTYFYSLFKKQYHLTPSQYREGKKT